jgi:WD40 repeat protein
MIQNEFNPYVGPRPFERKNEDSARFFGRSHETQEIVSLIFGHPITLIYAQSGAGKTSLFNASVTLNLEKNGFDVLPLTRVGGVVPKQVALKEIQNLYIFNALLNMDPVSDPRILLSKSLSEFLEMRSRATDENGQPLPRAIIFDQFEELFTYTPEDWREQRKRFFLQVVEALNADKLLRVVFVIREDFLAELDPYARDLPERLRIRYRLERLAENAALRAIKDPLANTSRKFAPGVAEELVKQLLVMRTVDATGKMAEIEGQYVEPVQLQVVCVTLWSALEPEVTEIQQTHLKNFNVNDALSDFYRSTIESAAKETGVQEANLRNWFGKTLITPMGTRSTVFRGEVSTGGIENSAVNFLESRHIIRAEFRAGVRWYELTHDRLVDPIIANNAKWFAANLSMFQQQSALWAAQGRPEGMLLRGKELDLAEEEQRKRKSESKSIPKDEIDFLNACMKAREREAREKRGNLLSRALAVVATISLIVAIRFAIQSFNNANIAFNNANNANIAKQTAEEAGAIAETQAAYANAQAATATYSLGQVASLSGLAEAEALAGQAQIALNQSSTVQLGRLLSVEAYKKNKISGEILPSVYQALVNSVAGGNDLLLSTRPFTSASFSFDGNEKRLVVDNYLWNLKDVQVTKLDLDSSQVVYSSFLSNKQVVIVTPNTDYYSSDQNPYNANIINLSNQEKAQIQLTVPEKANFLDVGLSDNGRWVTLMFGASENGGALLWDTQNPKQEPKQLLVQSSYVRDVARSPDGVSVSFVDDYYLYFWQKDARDIDGRGNLIPDIALDTGFAHGSFYGKSGRGLQFSPDGRWLAMQTETNIRIFDPNTQKLISGTPPSTEDEISGFLFSPDSKYLVYVVRSNQYTSVLRWSLEDSNRAPYEIYKSKTADVTALDISISGKLVIGDESGYVRIWDIGQDTKDPLLVASVHAGRITNILVGPDDQTVVSASEVDGTRLWNLSESESEAVLEYRIPSTVSSIARIDDGTSLAIGGVNSETARGVVHIYSDLPSPSPLSLESDLGSSLQALTVSGELIAAGRTYQPFYYNTPAYFLDFWDWNPDREEPRVVSFTMSSKVSSLTFYGQQYLVIATSTGELWLDDIADLKRLLGSIPPEPDNESSPTGLEMPYKLQLPNDLTNIQSLMFTKNGGYLIGASASGVRIWDTKQLSEGKLYQLPNAIFPAIISPDKKWLVTAGSDNTIQLYDLENITSSPAIIPIDKSIVTQFAFSGKGDQLAVANKLGEIAIYQLPVSEYPAIPIYTFQGSSGEITWLEFGSAGTDEEWLVASSGSDVYLWNTSRPNDKAVTLQSNSKVVYVSFTNDSGWIITLSTDQILRFWSMDLERMSETACIYAGRNMTRVEWNRYLPGKGDLQETCPGLGYGLEQVQTITESNITPTPYPTFSILLPTPMPSPTPQGQFTIYTIKEGDTLGLIAAKFGIDINTLIQDNNITNPNIVVPGQTLKIRIENTPRTP